MASLIGRKLLSFMKLEQLYPGRRLPLAIASDRIVLYGTGDRSQVQDGPALRADNGPAAGWRSGRCCLKAPS
jgi:hypothetical protein